MLEDIIPILQRTLGEDHVGMFMTRSNLGRAYFAAENWEKAQEMIRPMLAKIPQDHPDWIHNMYGYAHIQMKLGLIDEAEKQCITLLEMITQKKTLAIDNPRTVAIADLLLQIYRLQDREIEIASIKKNFPGTDKVKSEEQYDPYAIRKSSLLSEVLVPKRNGNSSSSQQKPKANSSARYTSSKKPSQNSSTPKLVNRRTF